MKISTVWLKDYVKLKGPLEEVANRLTLSGLEVKGMEKADGGLVFETEITSNRPDWLSYLGVAREISALYSTPVQTPGTEEPEKLTAFPPEFVVETRDPVLCPYYTGTILKGIKPCPTPEFIKKRLEAVGHRSINFVVDVTNFVLLECGQPLHAFDLKLLEGNKILIRRAHEGETLTGIDGKTYSLDTKDIVIADGARSVAIAGVMGGKETEVTDGTRDIFLESAFFQPASVRQTSRRLALSTDSSYRFERRVDPDGVNWARERAISLILKYTEVQEVTRVKTAGKKPVKKTSLHLPFEKLERTLGPSISSPQIEKIFKNLGLGIIQKNKKQVKVSIPSFRPDLVQAVDLIEEAARIYGYNRIPESLPQLRLLPDTLADKPKFEVIRKVTDRLVGAGFWEAQNYSIIRGESYEKSIALKESLVKINNPQNKDLNLMRPSLVPGLLETAQRNQYRGAKHFKFFEVGQIYLASGKNLPQEKNSLGFVVYGATEKTWSTSSQKVGLYDIKGTVEFLLETLGVQGIEWGKGNSVWTDGENTLELRVKGKSCGTVGEICPNVLKQFDMEGPVALAEIDLESLTALATKERTFRPVSKYPSIVRDMALLVPKELLAETVSSTILSEGSEFLKSVRLFDVYEGQNLPQGVKSLAFSLEYQSSEKTLSSEEIQKEHFRIAKVLQDKYSAHLPTPKS